MNDAYELYNENTGPLLVITFYQQWGSGDDQECIDFNNSQGVLYPTVAGSQGEPFIDQCTFIQAYTEYDIVAPNREIVEMNISPYDGVLLQLLEEHIQTGISGSSDNLIHSISLSPNPAAEYLNLNYSLQNTSEVKIEVYNIAGQLVRQLVDEDMPQGSHDFIWQGTDDSDRRLPSGIYIFRIETEEMVVNRVVTLVN
ncbi:MAG: T9SS type A sorting domain-containing protein [Candidatus Aegiribacteria sp.]|nr:T9SS type A sorting domain-containing protein [Candidatus Aegiribacteria sp.]